MVQQQIKEYTWDDLIAAIGQDFGAGGHIGVDEIDKTQIRHFCEALELDCPLHYDEEVARKHGYTGIIAPASSLTAPFSYSALWEPGEDTRFPVAEPDYHSVQKTRHSGPTPSPLPMPKTTAFFISGVEVEYFSDPVVGDQITTMGNKLLSVNVRDTTVGSGAFLTTEASRYNQHGRLISKQRTIGYHYNPWPPDHQPSEGRNSARQSTDEGPGLGARRKDLKARAGYIDWSVQRYFEDVSEGDEAPPVVINLTVQRIVEWASATHQFHPIHHNTRFVQKEGAPDMYANNVTCQSWWERTVREYIGLDGKIKKVGPIRIRIFNIPGDAVATTGIVRRKWQEGGENLIELEMWSEHDRGISVGPAPVIVALPSRR